MIELIFTKLQEAIKKVARNIKSEELLNDFEIKARQDYVSKYDLKLEQELIENIKLILPDVEIYSEENIKKAQKLAQDVVIIDPLDGTLNAMSEIPFYAISIAYITNNIPVIGITYDLNNGEMFAALKDVGFFINGKKMVRCATNKFAKSIAVSSGLIELAANANLSALSDLRKMARLRMLGSETLQLAYVAAGRLRANINFEAKYWDDIAGFIMLEEMGYVYHNFYGDKIFPKDYLDPAENLKSLACHPDDIKQLANILNNLS